MNKHSRKEQRRRVIAFEAFVSRHPPKMPAEFSHRDYKRVTSYAKIAFITGWNSGINDRRKHDRPTPAHARKA